MVTHMSVSRAASPTERPPVNGPSRAPIAASLLLAAPSALPVRVGGKAAQGLARRRASPAGQGEEALAAKPGVTNASMPAALTAHKPPAAPLHTPSQPTHSMRTGSEPAEEAAWGLDVALRVCGGTSSAVGAWARLPCDLLRGMPLGLPSFSLGSAGRCRSLAAWRSADDLSSAERGLTGGSPRALAGESPSRSTEEGLVSAGTNPTHRTTLAPPPGVRIRGTGPSMADSAAVGGELARNRHRQAALGWPRVPGAAHRSWTDNTDSNSRYLPAPASLFLL